MTVKPSVHCCVDPLFPPLLDALCPRRLMTNARRLQHVPTVERLMVRLRRERVREGKKEEREVEKRKGDEVEDRGTEKGHVLFYRVQGCTAACFFPLLPSSFSSLLLPPSSFSPSLPFPPPPFSLPSSFLTLPALHPPPPSPPSLSSLPLLPPHPPPPPSSPSFSSPLPLLLPSPSPSAPHPHRSSEKVWSVEDTPREVSFWSLQTESVSGTTGVPPDPAGDCRGQPRPTATHC